MVNRWQPKRRPLRLSASGSQFTRLYRAAHLRVDGFSSLGQLNRNNTNVPSGFSFGARDGLNELRYTYDSISALVLLQRVP